MNSIAINFVDCAIIVLYLIFIIWWGLRNGKSSDAGSYFLAGRTMPWWIVGLSLFAASISSTTLIGQSGDAYHTGVAVFNYNLTGVVVMVFFATFLLPLYIRSGIFTIPEFLERRFDKRSRYYFSGICIVGNIFLDAAGALYAAALIIKLLFPEADLQLIIIFFAVLVGMAISLCGDKAKPAAAFFDAMSEVMIRVTSMVMHYAPIGVFALMAYTVSNHGLEVLLPGPWSPRHPQGAAS